MPKNLRPTVDLMAFKCRTLKVNVYLVINKCVTAVILSNFSRHYLRKRSTLDIEVLGYIGVL
jgi:hypothetical protein